MLTTSSGTGLRFPSVSITWNCKLSCYMPSGVGLRLPSVSTTWNCTLLISIGPGRGPRPHTLHPPLSKLLSEVCVGASHGRRFLSLIGAGICPVASYEAVEIANISTSMTQTVATMATVPPQVHKASWVTLRFTAPQRQKLSWMPGWNHGLPGHGLTLRNGKDVPPAIKMIWFSVPHLSLYGALVKTYGCKGVFPGEFFWLHL